MSFEAHIKRPYRFGPVARAVFAMAIMGLVCSRRAASQQTAQPQKLAVAGTYQTVVTLVAAHNSCGAVTVQNNLTSVAHTPGARTLTVTHASQTYAGTIDSTARFATVPKAINAGDTRYTLAIRGTFTRTGLDATVQVDVRQPTTPNTCSYTVRWIGTKDGKPNSIP